MLDLNSNRTHGMNFSGFKLKSAYNVFYFFNNLKYKKLKDFIQA